MESQSSLEKQKQKKNDIWIKFFTNTKTKNEN